MYSSLGFVCFSPPLPHQPLLLLLLLYYLPLFLFFFFFLVPLTSPDWSFSRQCSSKQMSQAGLTPLYSHPASSHLSSRCRLSQQIALPRKEVNKTPPPPLLQLFFSLLFESRANSTCPLSEKGKYYLKDHSAPSQSKSVH